ncbi:MAG TPA: respiratory nitrate reductase subunit gamma, partial [Acidobacteriota bacterium]|nr:respiratory nitrate reductase subunit gamma [Acidobacteriota bacterium]
MPPLSEATRTLLWNISHIWIMYALFGIALVIFAWGLYKRIDFWRKGKSDGERLSDWGRRLKVMLAEVFLQKRVRNSRYPGIMHVLVFYSFIVLIVTTIVVMIQYDANKLFGLNLTVYKGFVYVFLTIASEMAGILILVGLGMAAYRRYIMKPETVPVTREDGGVLLLIAAIVVTGFLVEGARIAVDDDPWKALSFVGWGVSILFPAMTESAGSAVHASLWWLHTFLAMGWIAIIPYTKFFHMLSLPTNAFFSKLRPR